MVSNIKEIVAILLAAVMGWSVLFAASGASALFSSRTISTGSTISVGTLSFAATEARDESICAPTDEICWGGDINSRLNLTQTGSLDFNYSVAISNAASSPVGNAMDICDNLQVSDGKKIQTLKDYQSGASLFSATPVLNLAFHLVSDDRLLHDQTCDFDYVIGAWQANLPSGGSGFTNKYVIHASITSDPWVATPAPVVIMPTVSILNSRTADLTLAIDQFQATASTTVADDTGGAAVMAALSFQAVPPVLAPSEGTQAPQPVPETADKVVTPTDGAIDSQALTTPGVAAGE